MITLFRRPDCYACDEAEEKIKELVIKHVVVDVELLGMPKELPEETEMPVIKDEEKLIIGHEEVKAYLPKLEKYVEQWNKFQGDTCYADDDGVIY